MNHAISSETIDHIDRLFERRATRGAAPSCVWGVFDRSGLVHSGSSGSIGASRPNENTAYRIASCTKSFTASAVLALRDTGALSLDDPITRFVPAFAAVKLPTPDAPVPTIRMLLTMSAGFPTDNPWGDRQESISAEQLDSLLEAGLSFDSIPGTRFEYSNLGFALVGRAIEVASGNPYRDFVTERFITPLGLSATAFDQSVAAAGGVAVGSYWLDEHRFDKPGVDEHRVNGRWEELPFSGPGAFSPIGGLFSTVADLSRWATWLAAAFDPDVGERDGQLLSRASRRELQQLQRFAPGHSDHPTGYGLGLFVEEYPGHEAVTSHSGGYPGFSAHMRWSQRSGLGVVAFENATAAQVSAPATDAFDHLIAANRKASRGAAPRVSAQARVMQAEVTKLIRNWTVEGADRLCSENVALDEPYERRVKAINRAIAAIGGLSAETGPSSSAGFIGADEKSSSASHLVYFMPGLAGRLRVEILLTPENPARIQTLKVAADRA